MKSTVFQRSALALAISGAALAPVHAWSDLLDGASAVLTLRDAPDDYEISGFDMVAFPGGSFAVVWTEHSSSFGFNDKLFLQLFSKSGTAIGSARQLAQTSGSGQAFGFPTVDGDLDGNLALAWTVIGSTSVGDTACEINSDSIRGLTLSPPFTSSNTLPLYENMGTNPCSPEIAMDDDGDFVLAWSNYDGFDHNMSVQKYLAGGLPTQGVRGLITGLRNPARVSIQDNQTMLFGWTESSSTLIANGRRFDHQLNPLGDQFEIMRNDTFGSGSSASLNITEDVGGGFITSLGMYRDNLGINQSNQVVSADGSLGIQSEIIDISGSSIVGGTPNIASDSEGNVVSIWDYTSFSLSPNNAVVATATNRTGQVIEGGTKVIQDLGDDTIRYGSRIAMNNDVIVIGWVPDDEVELKTIQARILQPLATESSSEEEDGLFGSANPWLLALLGSLLGVWRRLKSR